MVENPKSEMRTVKPRRSCRVPLSRMLLGCDIRMASKQEFIEQDVTGPMEIGEIQSLQL